MAERTEVANKIVPMSEEELLMEAEDHLAVAQKYIVDCHVDPTRITNRLLASIAASLLVQARYVNGK
ncbi:hypothetical protein A2482_04565 [Candidatus Falkowbacteria bacterium RIFOXYC2_FULL_48_21]|uniref:Uncharacterized protein n=1 Tax=Candidatus Falkowbacteria bacterium RIFOXYC2_FULL_48_21 TaxID=1798005 RepID=A0A1F5T543_9BACT|nr:MAG: hypothetical protein A2482_04565 [Candidatus Falkowbacteria bacterium RIFOXYC2_FULL_48_21]